jgi:hypothetical protein
MARDAGRTAIDAAEGNLDPASATSLARSIYPPPTRRCWRGFAWRGNDMTVEVADGMRGYGAYPQWWGFPEGRASSEEHQLGGKKRRHGPGARAARTQRRRGPRRQADAHHDRQRGAGEAPRPHLSCASAPVVARSLRPQRGWRAPRDCHREGTRLPAVSRGLLPRDGTAGSQTPTHARSYIT